MSPLPSPNGHRARPEEDPPAHAQMRSVDPVVRLLLRRLTAEASEARAVEAARRAAYALYEELRG